MFVHSLLIARLDSTSDFQRNSGVPFSFEIQRLYNKLGCIQQAGKKLSLYSVSSQGSSTQPNVVRES